MQMIQMIVSTPLGIYQSKATEATDEAVDSFNSFMEKIPEMAMIRFKDEFDDRVFLPEGIAKRSVFKLRTFDK